MSYANGTQFYNLPQTVGTDKRDWFDTNEAFAEVDAALHAAATGQAADAEAIATINTSLASAESDIAALQTASTTQASEISALQSTLATQGTAITDVRQDAEDMISAFNEGAASVSTHAYAIGDYFIYNDVLYKATAAIAIGDTIVPNTNCSATNVTSEIKVINADIDDVKSDLSDYVIVRANNKTGVSVGADANVEINGYIDEVSGYKPLLVIYKNNNGSNAIFASDAVSDVISDGVGLKYTLRITNPTNNNFNDFTVRMRVIYIRDI